MATPPLLINYLLSGSGVMIICVALRTVTTTRLSSSTNIKTRNGRHIHFLILVSGRIYSYHTITLSPIGDNQGGVSPQTSTRTRTFHGLKVSQLCLPNGAVKLLFCYRTPIQSYIISIRESW